MALLLINNHTINLNSIYTMKKILPVALVAVLLALGSCSKSPADKFVDLCDSYTSKIEKVESAEDFQKLQQEFYDDAEKFQKENSQEVLKSGPDKEAAEKVEKARKKLADAAEKKMEELAKSAALNGLNSSDTFGSSDDE